MKRAFNIIFWLVVSVILFFGFGASFGNYVYTFYFLVFFIPITVLTSWYFNSILLPSYLLKGKYKKFFLYTFYTLVISLDIEMVLIFLAFILMSKYDFENMSAIVAHYKWMPVIMYFIVLIMGLVTMVQQYQVMKMQLGKLNKDDRKLSVRSDRKSVMIELTKILYIESMSDYINIYTEGGDVFSSRDKISSIAIKLSDGFTRIHRSFLVNDTKIVSYSKEMLKVGEKELPISRTYKEEFVEKMTELKMNCV